jgi:hypothetical protein
MRSFPARLGASTVVAVLAVACSSAAPGADVKADKNAVSTHFGNATAGNGPNGTAAGCQQDPSFYDVPGDGCDNDGNGKVDDAPTCDGDASGDDATTFAHALGLCDDASKKGYGLVSATFTRGFQVDAAPEAGQHGVLTKFGSLAPREGARLGVLSTGFAQEFDGSDGTPFAPGQEWGTDGAVPPGFPKAAAGCEQDSDVHDVIDLKLTLKAPPNATGFRFDFNFHSSEWPEYICTEFNDGFIAYLTAKGFNSGSPDNVSFDAKNNPVSVNNGFFDRCTPKATVGCFGDHQSTSVCGGGAGELQGTGFGLLGDGCQDDPGSDTGAGQVTLGGATGWLSSRAPVTPGETFTLELIIWDTGDSSRDSSVLLDDFQWIGGAVTTTTERAPAVK